MTVAVAISHGHYDHTGGISATLAACQKTRLFPHPDALRERYARSADGAVRAAGFPLDAGELFATPKGYVHWMNAVTHLQPAVCMTGESPRSLPPEAPAGTFFLGTSCTISDPLPNHQAPAFETADALVHFPRCSHAGVRNTLSCALSHSRPGRLRAIVGGMHRAATPPEVVALRADAIEELHPQLICPCHCNGDSARDYLKGRFPDAFQTASTGCALALNAGSESFGRMYAG